MSLNSVLHGNVHTTLYTLFIVSMAIASVGHSYCRKLRNLATCGLKTERSELLVTVLIVERP